MKTRALVRGHHPSVRGHHPSVRGLQPFVRRQRTNVRGQQTNVRRQQTNVRDNRRMSVAPRLLSVAPRLLSAAPRPLSAGDRPLDVVPIHFHTEVPMAKRFPRSESDINTLAARVIDGLTNAAEDFPAPPVSCEELRGKLDAFQAADTATVAAQTSFRNQHAEKDEALEELKDALKADLRYAEVAVRDAPQKLNALGWRPPRDGTPLQPPGETRDITIVSEGDTWAILRWKPPADGGAHTALIHSAATVARTGVLTPRDQVGTCSAPTRAAPSIDPKTEYPIFRRRLAHTMVTRATTYHADHTY